MMRASHKQPGFIAALLHRLAGIALVIFLPVHFWALSGALNGADVLDKFLKVTDTPLVKFAEGGIVVALADFTMISGFDCDITQAIPNGAMVEIDPNAERPFIRLL